MSELFDRLRAALPNLVFHPPATAAQINRVERQLETRFPAWLRDLYLCTNGIENPRNGDSYLFPLEGSEQSLLEWNQFIRGLEGEHSPIVEATVPACDPGAITTGKLLMITYMNCIEWAIDPEGGTQIILHDVRDPDHRPVIGADLVEACCNELREDQEIREKLFRGRTPVRRDGHSPSPTCDVELIYDILNTLLHSMIYPLENRIDAFPSGNLYRAISQRPGETGVLHILGWIRSEIQIASGDGNIPFVLRSKPSFYPEAITCLVKNLSDAILCILCLVDLDGQTAQTLDDRTKSQLITAAWRDRGGAPIPEFEAVASVLFRRDDLRLKEENPLGE